MSSGTVVALSGGVGGAKLSLGLLGILPPNTLSIVVNTGDDFAHLGLSISPDIDTTLYTLSDRANPETGWGQRDETWRFMEEQAHQGGETWFKLGDRDLEVHAERTRRLRSGETLSAITDDFARRFGIAAAILPMSNDLVSTRVVTDQGELCFQEYFVRRQCRPCIHALRFAGATAAQPSPGAVAALRASNLVAIVICPSNPWLSIDPIRALSGMRELLRASSVPVVAVSPLVGGKAVKGPTAKIMTELGLPVTPSAVARHYAGWIDGFVLDIRDHEYADEIQLPTLVCDTLMQTVADRQRLAGATLEFAATLTTERAEA
ncbi:MAG: 2-phospho-L-lactate transferase [Betaproteobacteria bacterium]|nr:2-phospho-L-lactate transferase [Betaproteobacteria bacterium]